jgi:hypothetical protein
LATDPERRLRASGGWRRERARWILGPLLDDVTWQIVLYAVLSLTVVRILTARPLTERYAHWWNSHPRNAQPVMESVPAGEHRLRRPSQAVWLDGALAAAAETDEPLVPASGACESRRRPIRQMA